MAEAKEVHLIPEQQFQIDPRQVRNNAGGFVFKESNIDRLKRFLVLGSEGSTYYASGKELCLENVKSVVQLLKDGRGKEVVHIIREMSEEGRCAKQTAIVYCLALCARYHDGNHSQIYITTRQEAYTVLSKVCRIPTDLFQFVQFCEEISKGINTKTGWGRAHKRAIRKWYFEKTGEKLAYLVTKYQQRNGWSHKDILKLSHPKVDASMKSHAIVFKYIIKGFAEAKSFTESQEHFPSFDEDASKTIGFLLAVNKATSIGNDANLSEEEKEDEILQLIKNHELTREHIPTQMLKSLKVWYSLLCNMPMTALIRNLGNMSALGMFENKGKHQGTEIAMRVCDWLRDEERLKKARIHPFNVLVALKTYESGKGERSSKTWQVNEEIVKALDDAFYKSFKFVEPTNKRYLLGIDVSGSMSYGGCSGCPVIKPSEAAAAMAMVALKSEPNVTPLAFSERLVPLNINKDMRLEQVLKATRRVMMGATDCAQPMIFARQEQIPVDVFIVYTDSETWIGQQHPFEALKQYRAEMNCPDAKLIVCAMQSNGFTIADPDDPGMLDIVGFDSAAPQIIAQFAEQKI